MQCLPAIIFSLLGGKQFFQLNHTTSYHWFYLLFPVIDHTGSKEPFPNPGKLAVHISKSPYHTRHWQWKPHAPAHLQTWKDSTNCLEMRNSRRYPGKERGEKTCATMLLSNRHAAFVQYTTSYLIPVYFFIFPNQLYKRHKRTHSKWDYRTFIFCTPVPHRSSQKCLFLQGMTYCRKTIPLTIYTINSAKFLMANFCQPENSRRITLSSLIRLWNSTEVFLLMQLWEMQSVKTVASLYMFFKSSLPKHIYTIIRRLLLAGTSMKGQRCNICFIFSGCFSATVLAGFTWLFQFI